MAGPVSHDISMFLCETAVRGFLEFFIWGIVLTVSINKSKVPIHFPSFFEAFFFAPRALFHPDLRYCRVPVVDAARNVSDLCSWFDFDFFIVISIAAQGIAIVPINSHML